MRRKRRTKIIEKQFVEKNGKTAVRTTFTLPQSTWADTIYLVGDFNDWCHTCHPMQRDSDGRWTITVDLGPGCAYQFRYLRDGVEWMNDRQADAYVPNPYGSDNSVIIADPGFKPYYDGKD
jgi:1,4-alpha-glucan branching enzyme